MEKVQVRPKVNVIILNYLSFSETIEYVHQLRKQKEIELNILIVDNKSPNESFDMLLTEFQNIENVTVIETSKNRGYACGNNFGLRMGGYSKDDLIIISNNDLVIDDEYLFSKWVDIHLGLSNVAISAPVMKINGMESKYPAWKIPSYFDSFISSIGSLELIVGDKKKYDIQHFSDIQLVECLPGSLFMIEYSLFEKLNFFDEGTFLYMEEIILARKIKDMGFDNYLIGPLNYNHLGSKTISSVLSSYKMHEHLMDGICYYHKKYNGINRFSEKVLRFNFLVWKVEHYFKCLFFK